MHLRAKYLEHITDGVEVDLADVVHLVGVVEGVGLVNHRTLQLPLLANLRNTRIRDRKRE